MTMKRSAVITAAILLTAGAAFAAADPAAKCQAAKSKAVGAYYACREKADATAIAKGGSADYAKCDTKFLDKWGSAETASAGACPDNLSSVDMGYFVIGQATDSSALLAGGSLASCGDGQINAAGEQCDGAALGGATCASYGLYGTIGCTAGCKLDLSTCTACPAGTTSYKGKCFVLGALNGSCDEACTALSLVYDDATLTMTGSSGTDADCLAMLDATGAPGDALQNPGGSDCVNAAAGCAVISAYGYRVRCTSPPTTSSDKTQPGAQRICACH